MSNAIDDKELGEYLSGDTQFSRRYREIEADTVPVEMDRLVLAQANANIVNASKLRSSDKLEVMQRRSTRLSFWMRVGAPIALAASIVLVVTIVIESGVQYRSVPTDMETRALPEQKQQNELRREDVSHEPVRGAAQTESAAAPTELDKNVVSLATTRGRESKDSAKPGIQPSQFNEITVTARRRERSADETALPVAVVTAEELEAKHETTATSATAAPSVPDATPASSAAVAATSAGVSAKSVVESNTADAAAENRKKSESGAKVSDLEEIVVTGQLIRGSRSSSAAQIAKQEREADPSSWLAYIRELRTEGSTRVANGEWKRFIKAFPNYPVDETDSARPKK